MFYEGAGTGNLQPGSSNSRTARNSSYGGYAVTNFSHNCVSRLNISADDIEKAWEYPAFSGKFIIRNVGTGLYLSIKNDIVSYQKYADESCILDINKTSSGSFFSISNNSKYMYVPSESAKPYQIIMATSSQDKKSEWFIYNIGNIVKIQNRFSGLFLYPYANSFNSGCTVGQGMETSNPNLWHEFILFK